MLARIKRWLVEEPEMFLTQDSLSFWLRRERQELLDKEL